MDFRTISLDQRIMENIKGYDVDHLYPITLIRNFLQSLSECTKADFLLTDRHGVHIFATNGCRDLRPEVSEEPGIKIRVSDRTVAHLYFNLEQVDEDKRESTQKLFEQIAELMAAYGQESYFHKELDLYSDDLEQLLEKEKFKAIAKMNKKRLGT